MRTTVYIALGSNLGDRKAHINRALACLSALATNQLAVSSLYVTVPEAMGDVPDFVNAVACFETQLSARDLLSALQRIEVSLGRSATHGLNQSRTIDLDIIAFGDHRIDEAGLIVPHPRAHLRHFVLVPLAELAPAMVLPGQSKSVAELAGATLTSGRIIAASANDADGA